MGMATSAYPIDVYSQSIAEYPILSFVPAWENSLFIFCSIDLVLKYRIVVTRAEKGNRETVLRIPATDVLSTRFSRLYS